MRFSVVYQHIFHGIINAVKSAKSCAVRVLMGNGKPQCLNL